MWRGGCGRAECGVQGWATWLAHTRTRTHTHTCTRAHMQTRTRTPPQELDAGTACLPRGSEVVFVNDHNRSATMGQVLLGLNLQNVKVRPALRAG